MTKAASGISASAAADQATADQATGADQAAVIERAIRASASPRRAADSRAYLKVSLEFTGTTVPDVRAYLRSWRRDRPDLTRGTLLAVVTALWSRPVFECRLAAVLLLTDRRALLTAADASLVEDMLRSAGTWALVDSLSADVMGSLVESYPELTDTLDRWSGDENFWLRRSAMLALLVPLRRGGGDFGRFARYGDQMLDEREFFIRKAIGWVLRETGKHRPDLVDGWITPRVGRASGVTVREAVKPLPPARREELMAAYRASRPAGRSGAGRQLDSGQSRSAG